MNPEFSFDEIIELIRWTTDINELIKLSKVMERDAHSYCLFHLELISQALHLQTKYIAKADARELRYWFKQMGLL